MEPPICSICGKSLEGGFREDTQRLCVDCLLRPPFFSRARSMGKYEGPLLEALHLFKYRKNITAGERLAKMMSRWALDLPDLHDFDLVVPVPLHPAKLRKRGFNQSLILARRISQTCSIPLDATILVKVSDGDPQVELGRKERKANVRNRFTLAKGKSASGLKILLIDDVYTTGSTVGECARILLKGGAREAAVLTLARA